MANPSNNKQSGNSRRSGGASGSNRSGSDFSGSSDASMSSFDDQSSSGTSEMGSGSTGSDESRSASGSNQSSDQSQPKSVGSVIAESLARESQEKIDRVLGQFNGYFTTTTSYVSSNAREATAIAVTAGMVAWVLLGTKPGRRVFEMGASMVIPELSKWVQNNFAGLGGSSGQGGQASTH